MVVLGLGPMLLIASCSSGAASSTFLLGMDTVA